MMVGPDEIERVAAALSRSKDEVAEPYPEEVVIRYARCRLGWALRRDEAGACRIHDGTRCLAYDDRPWLCRTYPFMLDAGCLIVSECPGLGAPLSYEEALLLARDLVARQAAEEEEARAVRTVLASAALPAGGIVVVDAGGVTRL